MRLLNVHDKILSFNLAIDHYFSMRSILNEDEKYLNASSTSGCRVRVNKAIIYEVHLTLVVVETTERD